MNKISCQNNEDLVLLQGLMSGDNQVVKKIYQTMSRPITQYLKIQGADQNIAEDLFQEALVSLFKRLNKDNFDLTCRLQSYLKIVARNLWLKHIRDHKREVLEDTIGHEAISIDGNMQTILESQEKEALLWSYFKTLPEGCQNILQWFFSGSSMREIAEKLNSTVAYIKKRKYQCKERLVELVQSDNKFKELRWDQ